MKLHYSPTSPYVRKVMIVALESGQAGKLEKATVNLADPNAAYAKDNPLAKVPALVADDGLALFDSPVICEYLDAQHKGAKMFPPPGPARWKALRFQALADGLLDAALLRRYEAQRPQNLQSQEWADKQKLKMTRALDTLEAEAADLEGPLTIGSITVGCALGYLDLRFAAERWRQGRPRLAAWYEKTAQRQSFLETVPRDPA
jgi:glutathione S-transferase